MAGKPEALILCPALSREQPAEIVYIAEDSAVQTSLDFEGSAGGGKVDVDLNAA